MHVTHTSVSLAQIRKAVTSRTRATREVTHIHTQHDRIRDHTDSDCIVCFSRVSAARGCCEVCCWSASVSLNTSHYAAPDQRGGYQQKQGYHRGAYERLSICSPRAQSSFGLLIWSQCLACETERLCLSVVCRSERRRLPAEAELPARRIPEPEPELVLIRCGFVPDPDRRFHRLQTPYNTRSQPLGFILNTYNDSTVSVLFYRFWSRGFGYDIAGLVICVTIWWINKDYSDKMKAFPFPSIICFQVWNTHRSITRVFLWNVDKSKASRRR